MRIKQGSTGVIRQIFVEDSTSPGDGLTGLTWDSVGLTAYYDREFSDESFGFSLAEMVPGLWVSGGFVEIDSTNMPGYYQLGLPDEILVAGATYAVLMLRGAADMFPARLEIELLEVDELDILQAAQLTYGLNVPLPLLDSPDREDQSPSSVYWTLLNGGHDIVDRQFAPAMPVSGGGCYYNRKQFGADCGAMAVVTVPPTPSLIGDSMITLGIKLAPSFTGYIALDYRVTETEVVQITLRQHGVSTAETFMRIPSPGDKLAIISVGTMCYGFFCSALTGVWEPVGSLAHTIVDVVGWVHLWISSNADMNARVGNVYAGNLASIPHLADTLDLLFRVDQGRIWMTRDVSGGFDRWQVVFLKNGVPISGEDVVSPVILVVDLTDEVDLFEANLEVGGGTLFHNEDTNKITIGHSYAAHASAIVDGLYSYWIQFIGRDA